MTEHGKVLLAAIYLSGDAITWYQAWQEEQLAEHLASGFDDEVLQYDWAVFQAQLKLCFMSLEYLQRLQDEWKGLKQNGTPVMSFSNKVLQVEVQLRKSDKSRLKAFLYGLDDYIKFDVRVMSPSSFNAAVGVALQHEMKHNKGKPKDASKSSTTSQTPSTSNPQNQVGKNLGKNSNGYASSTPKAQNTQANANKNGKGKAQESTPLTPDEKMAKGVIGGRLSSEEIASYSKD